MSSSRFAAGSGARFVGVRLPGCGSRLPAIRLAVGFAGCFARGAPAPSPRPRPQPRRGRRRRTPSPLPASSFPCRRDFRDDVSSSGPPASWARRRAPVPEAQAVLLPPWRPLRRPPLLPASCRSETSVVPSVSSSRVIARGPRTAIGRKGLALRGFKTVVDMTCGQATSRPSETRSRRRGQAAAGRRRARRARTARRRCERRAQAHGSSSP